MRLLADDQWRLAVSFKSPDRRALFGQLGPGTVALLWRTLFESEPRGEHWVAPLRSLPAPT
jgi:hypothetical protein